MTVKHTIDKSYNYTTDRTQLVTAASNSVDSNSLTILTFNYPYLGREVAHLNTELVKANWEIGRHIVEFERHGHEQAGYGSNLLSNLSTDLKLRYGKGFGQTECTGHAQALSIYASAVVA